MILLRLRLITLKILTLFISILVSKIDAQNSALSVHLIANDNFTGDILVKTLNIPHKTFYTYYCALNWNTGFEGGGYCGMQNHPNGNNFIFSIWDPISSNQPIKAIYQGGGTLVENFGGEGTGLKSWNFELGWAEGYDYQLVTRNWDVGNHTHFGFWVHDISRNNWTHLVTMDFPVANVRFKGNTGSFLEDWSNTGPNNRKVYQKYGYKRRTFNNAWTPFNNVNFSINTNDIQPSARSYNFRNIYNAGIEGEYYFMTSGGSVTPDFAGTSIVLNNNFPNPPNFSTIDFFITEINRNKISWTVPQFSTPQFKVSILLNEEVIFDSIATELNSVNIDADSTSKISITIEDILGNIKTQILTLGFSELAPKTPNGLKSNSIGNTSFNISWDKSDNAEYYKIQLQDNYLWKTIDSTVNTNYFFDNLKEGSTQKFRVNAVNDFGESAYTDFFKITLNFDLISSKNWALQYVDSQELSGENGAAVNAFDGNKNTIWHTAWSSGNPSHPHEIQIDLGDFYDLTGFKYLPRQDGGVNGTIADYEFYISDDGINWGNFIKKGKFDQNLLLKEVEFDSLYRCKFIRFNALSEINGGPWTSMAELMLTGKSVVSVDYNYSLPKRFELNQNYPNPFNPSTTISYTIPVASSFSLSQEVRLTIYDLLGREVETLVNESQSGRDGPGYYKVEWNAKNFASGMYIYQLSMKHGNKTELQRKKLMLLK